MFERVVVGTDGSDTASVAVAQAVGLATRVGAEVLVVSAFTDDGAGGDTSGEAHSLLRDCERRHRGTAPMRVAARKGEPAEVLIGVAADENADLVVVGNRGLTGARIRGGVPDKVSHRAPCSVLIADTSWAAILPPEQDPHHRPDPSKVLIATDGSPTADRASATGAELAKALGARVLLLHVGERSHGEAVLRRTAKDIGDGLDLETGTRAGDPPTRIIETAKEWPADLIVVGSKGMHGLRRVFLGGVPNHVTHHAPCSVLVVKTD